MSNAPPVLTQTTFAVVPLCDAHPPPELQYVITDSGAAIVIYHKSFAGKFTSLQTTIPNIRWIEIDDYKVKDPKEVVQVSIINKLTLGMDAIV